MKTNMVTIKLCINHREREKQVKLMDGSCEAGRGEFPPVRTVPAIVCCCPLRPDSLSEKTPVALSSRKTPTTADFHTWDLAPLNATSVLGPRVPPLKVSVSSRVLLSASTSFFLNRLFTDLSLQQIN